MKKIVRYSARTSDNDELIIVASDMSLTGALVNFVAEEEVSELNPFTKKYEVVSLSVQSIHSITPEYEEVEDE